MVLSSAEWFMVDDKTTLKLLGVDELPFLHRKFSKLEVNTKLLLQKYLKLFSSTRHYA
jgi:hypothetical protein